MRAALQTPKHVATCIHQYYADKEGLFPLVKELLRALGHDTLPQHHTHTCTQTSQAAGEEGLPSLAEELLRALEDAAPGGRAAGAAGLIAGYCRGAGGERRGALQEHVDSIMTVSGVCGFVYVGVHVKVCVGKGKRFGLWGRCTSTWTRS